MVSGGHEEGVVTDAPGGRVDTAPAPTGDASPPRPGPPLGAALTVGVVALALALAIGVALASHHGPLVPWTITVIGGLLAVGASVGWLTLPANPLLRHLAVAGVAGLLLLLFSDHVSAFSDFQIAQVAYYVPAAAGLTLLVGWNGQLSLGHGALMAIGAYTVAVLMAHNPTFPVIALILAAVVVTGLAGAVIGVAAARLRGPYLAGATLALAVALPELATRYSGTLGGAQGLPVRPLGVPTWLSETFPAERWLAWVGIVSGLVVLVLLANLMRSGIGRRLRTVRDDEVAASLAGVNVARTQVMAFVVSAACAGLAGALYGFATSLANPAAFSLILSLSLVTAIVIGGLGSLAGAVLGATALVFVPRLTTNVSNRFKLDTSVKGNLPLAVYGLLLVLAMLTFPDGIVGGLRRLARFVTPRHRSPPAGSAGTAPSTSAPAATAPTTSAAAATAPAGDVQGPPAG